MICQNCYVKAKRTRGICACGHRGVLSGVVNDEPACRGCSGVTLNVDCVACGAEDEIWAGGRCWNCALCDLVDDALTYPATGRVATELLPLAAAIKGMSRANSGLTWIRQAHVQAFFRTLVTRDTISHAVLDQLPASPTREFVRGLLVEHAVLPRRDENLARFSAWVTAATTRLESAADKEILTRYVRWHHLRHLHTLDVVSTGSFLRAKQSVTVAIDFLNWLNEQSIPLEELTQTHLDRWMATGPSTRQIASRFLGWAIKTHLVARHLRIPPHARVGSARMSASDQELSINRVVHTEELAPRERAASILVLIFGQQIRDIVKLTWDQVVIGDNKVTIRMGGFDVELPPPLDEPWRHVAANPDHEKTAAHPNSNWVFRGGSPGQHLNASYFRTWIRKYFSAREARLGTLHELTKLGATAIIAEALGYTPATIERHAKDSASKYARYISNIRHVTPTRH